MLLPLSAASNFHENKIIIDDICSPSLWVTARSAPITNGTTVTFTPHIGFSFSFSPWYISSLSCSFFQSFGVHLTS